MEILRNLERDREDGDAYVFAGEREGSPLSNMAWLMMLRRHHGPRLSLDL
jgi:hypothetical protein